MKKFIKKVLFEAVKYLLITAVLWGIVFCGYSFNGMSNTKIYSYILENSEVGATSFSPYNPDYYYTYKFRVSDDIDKNSEIWIFEATNLDISKYFPLFICRYKHFLNESTDKTVGIIHTRLDAAAETNNNIPNDVVIYYSNNQKGIANITYSLKNKSTGEIETKTEYINKYRSFVFIIPVIYNSGNYQYDFIGSSFYNSDNELIFEDIPGQPV